MKRWLIMLGAVLVLVLIVGGIKACGIKKMMDGYATMGEPTSTVSTVRAAYEEWQPSLSAVGSLRAVRGVDLASEVSGLVDTVHFRSGEEVSAGALLVKLVVQSDLARLDALKAEAALAKSVSDRAEKQLEAQALSQAQLDTERAKLKVAQAAVLEQQALIAKKSLRAPFAGQLGISAVNPGQYLNPGDKVVTLQQLDPIHLDFALPQGSLSQLKPGMRIDASTDAFPGENFLGQISAIDPVVDAQTRNIRIQATLKNPGRKLLPGMFANINIAAGASKRYLTLPQNAVAFNPYGETVFVIVARGEENAPDPNKPAELTQTEALKKADAELKAKAAAKNGDTPAPTNAPPTDGKPQQVARQVFIEVGPRRGDQVAVISGLKEGDEVVTSGQLKLKNGTLVVINNTVQPGNVRDPRPVDQ